MEVNSEACHEKQEECIICLDDGEAEWRDLECHHRYHKQCIENWIAIRAKCPMCMKDIENHKIINNIREVDHISIRRLILFMVIVIGIIIVTVLCSS